MAFSIYLQIIAAAMNVVTYHNASDCCCQNLPVSHWKLVGSPEECASSCAADPACHAALYDQGSQAGRQCKASGPLPAGKNACCLHKGHFDTMHADGNAHTVVIDMGTTNYTSNCPGQPPRPSPSPPAPAPPPAPGPPPYPAETVRPFYHFTRASGEMNDPNGLMWQWQHGANGSKTPEYHMFHQHASSCQNDSPLPHTGTHAWGHGVSPDLVHWKRMVDSGVCGSTSGGITLGAELKAKTGWDAAILVSAPSMSAIGAKSVGLHLYTSNSSQLETWQQYIPHPLPSNGDPCVICPSIVPNWTQASNIGDSYVWSVPAADKALEPGEIRTVYVLSGSSACDSDENGGHWCGYAHGKPQTLLFSSTDLVEWKFENVFWKGGSTANPGAQLRGGGSVYTPDTFQLADGRQALFWLGGGTLWNVGRLDAKNGTFLDLDDGTSYKESNGAFHCGQSMTDAKGRRVQFGWLNLKVNGAGYSGAQSLPRVITAAPAELNAGPGKLMFAPLPELATLHDSSDGGHLVKNVTLRQSLSPSPSQSQSQSQSSNYTMLEGLDQTTALHHHVHVATTISLAGGVDTGFTLCVECNAKGENGVTVSVQVRFAPAINNDARSIASSTVKAPPQLVCFLGNGEQRPLSITDAALAKGSVDVALDIFTDGAVIEMFANNGEAVGEQGRPYVNEVGVGFAAMGAAAAAAAATVGEGSITLNVELWKMQQSIE